MKNQNRFYKLLLGVALIAELVCFALAIKSHDKHYKIQNLNTGEINITYDSNKYMIYNGHFTRK
jgi:hypothetical protein